MRLAAREYGDWFTDPELERLRREWIAAYRAWVELDLPSSCDAVLTEEQRETLRRYHDAEAAYFARSRELAGGSVETDRPSGADPDARRAESNG